MESDDGGVDGVIHRAAGPELKSACLAFPAISTGAYGYPAHLAARVAASETKAFAMRRTAPFRVVFAVLGVAMVRHLERALTL